MYGEVIISTCIIFIMIVVNYFLGNISQKQEEKNDFYFIKEFDFFENQINEIQILK